MIHPTTKEIGSRYQVEFIFGEAKAYIVQVATNAEMVINLDQPVTEANYEDEFYHIVDAMGRCGHANANDKVSCVTFPEGCQRVYAAGQT